MSHFNVIWLVKVHNMCTKLKSIPNYKSVLFPTILIKMLNRARVMSVGQMAGPQPRKLCWSLPVASQLQILQPLIFKKNIGVDQRQAEGNGWPPAPPPYRASLQLPLGPHLSSHFYSHLLFLFQTKVYFFPKVPDLRVC